MLYFENYATVRDVLELKRSEDPDHAAILKVPHSASLMQLITYMHDHSVGVAFIHDENNKIIGLISERDIIRQIARNELNAFDMPIESFLTRDIFSCGLNDKLKAVAGAMADRHVRHVAVQNTMGDYIGVVSSSDVELFAGQG